MAETKDTVVIDFQINEGEALSSLEKTKKSIIDLKTQQAELNKAYKEGTVSLDAYAKESVQLEASLKKQQATYNTIQRQVTGLKNPFDKLNESIKEQANQVKVAGISLSAFANPVTATIGILGGLFKAYASSTIGAKDLEFAQNQLSAATTILTNEFASLFSSVKDGEGFFTGILNSILNSLGPAGAALASQSKALAEAQDFLQDLSRDEISVRGDINELLAENQEIMTKIQDSQTAYSEKVHLTGEMIANLRKGEEELLKIKQDQLDTLNRQLAADPENEDKQTAVLEKEKEISRIKSDTERKIQAIIRLESNLKDVEDKRVEATRVADEEEARSFERAKFERLKRLDDERVHQEELRRIEAEKTLADHDELNGGILKGIESRLAATKKLLAKGTDDFKKSKEEEKKIDFLVQQQKLANASYVFGQLANLFDKESAAYKFFAISQAFIDTYRAATAALAPPPTGAGPLFGPILAGTTIALGLANIGKIMGIGADTGIGQAAGGGSFVTKGPQMLIVGDNPGGVERVDVTPISGKGRTVIGKNMVAMAGGGTMFTDAAIASGMTGGMQMPTVNVRFGFDEFTEKSKSFADKNALAEI